MHKRIHLLSAYDERDAPIRECGVIPQECLQCVDRWVGQPPRAYFFAETTPTMQSSTI